MPLDVLISPRISFSHDVDVDVDADVAEQDDGPSDALPFPSSDAGFDFDFAFSVDGQGSLIRESSTADELFSDGILLPVGINFAATTPIATEITDARDPDRSPVFPCSEIGDAKVVKSLKEHLEDSTDDDDVEDEDSPRPQPAAARAFWKFGRSSSLNVGNYGRNRGKQSAPPSKAELLSRSKSTGAGLSSVTEAETETARLDCEKSGMGALIGSLKVILLRSNSTGEVLARKAGEAERRCRIRRSSSLNCDGRGSMIGYPIPLDRSDSTGSGLYWKQNSTRSTTSSSSSSGNGKTRQGRRSFKDYYASFYRGERVNPVLNLPSPYISRASVDLLGFGSLFCNGRHRKKRR